MTENNDNHKNNRCLHDQTTRPRSTKMPDYNTHSKTNNIVYKKIDLYKSTLDKVGFG